MDIVFGSSGFIGGHIFKHLVSKIGRENVIGIYNTRRKFISKNNYFKINLLNKGEFQKLAKFKINNVYICSGYASTELKNTYSKNKQVLNNEKMISNIIYFSKRKKVKKIIFFSSSAVYSHVNKFPLTENQILNPKNSLGISKKINEKQLFQLHKKTGIKVLILRLFTAYGKNMRKDQFISQIKKKILTKKKIISFNPETYRNFIFIDDLLKIIDKLNESKKINFTIFNVGSKKSYKIKNIISILCKIYNRKPKIKYLISNNNFDHIISIKKLKNKIKNIKFTKIEDGLKRI